MGNYLFTQPFFKKNGKAVAIYFLVAIVFQEFVFNSWGVPFEMTVILSILLIWIYTFRGGIKTVVWTDTLQTFLMILSVILSIYFITDSLDLTFSDYLKSDDFSMQNKIFVTDSLLEKNHFFKIYDQTLPSGKITPLVKIIHPKGRASVVVSIQYAFFASL